MFLITYGDDTEKFKEKVGKKAEKRKKCRKKIFKFRLHISTAVEKYAVSRKTVPLSWKSAAGSGSSSSSEIVRLNRQLMSTTFASSVPVIGILFLQFEVIITIAVITIKS